MRLSFEPEGELRRLQLPRPARGHAYVVQLVASDGQVLAGEPFHVEQVQDLPEAQLRATVAVLTRVRRYQ